MRVSKQTLLITVLFLCGLNTISGLDCRSRGTITEEFKNTAAVFSGKVISQEYQQIREVSDYDFGNEVLIVKLKVDKWWKGSGNSEVVLRTDFARNKSWNRRTGNSFFFKTEESYLVFAGYYKDWLITDNCTRTKVLSKADEDLKALGEGFQPKKN